MNVRRLFPLGLLIGLFGLEWTAQQGCQPSLSPVSDGHRRMVAILDSIRRNADPLQYLHLNSGRAAVYLERMSRTTGQEHISNKFNYAVELLKAGKNESALVQFKELIDLTGGVLNEQTKILHELLALCYMRLGEQQNCVDTHNPESCILWRSIHPAHRPRECRQDLSAYFGSISRRLSDPVVAELSLHDAGAMAG